MSHFPCHLHVRNEEPADLRISSHPAEVAYHLLYKSTDDADSIIYRIGVRISYQHADASKKVSVPW